MLNRKTSYKVKGYTNRWGIIATYKSYALMENETYGDETCYLVVSMDAPVETKEYTKKSTGEKIKLPTIMEVIAETFDGLEIALEDEGIL